MQSIPELLVLLTQTKKEDLVKIKSDHEFLDILKREKLID